MRRKYIKLAVVAIIMLVVIGRIIYVNVTYPFAGIHNKSIGDVLSVNGYNFKVSRAEYYSKAEWKEYLSTENIELEEEKYKLLYHEIFDEQSASEYDYYVSYNPTAEYTIIVVKLTFDDKVGKDERTMARQNINVATRINGSSYLYNEYYSEALASTVSDNELMSVYITNLQADTAHMVIMSFGNNMSIDLGKRK